MSIGASGRVLGPDEGRKVDLPGQFCTYKAARDDTAGAYALIESTLTGSGPPQHIHHAEEEAIYVLDGVVNIQIGDQVNHATSGSFVLIPRGTVHTYWNAGSTHAKLLVIVSPATLTGAGAVVCRELIVAR